MAKAYQCDRCFQYYTENKETVVPGAPSDAIATEMVILDKNVEGSGMPRRKKSYELCDECMKELVNWLYFRPNTRKEVN